MVNLIFFLKKIVMVSHNGQWYNLNHNYVYNIIFIYTNKIWFKPWLYKMITY